MELVLWDNLRNAEGLMLKTVLWSIVISITYNLSDFELTFQSREVSFSYFNYWVNTTNGKPIAHKGTYTQALRFQISIMLRIAKDHWCKFNTEIAQMSHSVNSLRVGSDG